ncbi:condensation domain-containing protein [Streptomyces sp. NPDC018045]|uniref:condensation domain-containing protein n=1 Tax=Streptomyces sp. NPDC018045 TaxID=3365037 RepID=UPI00379B2BFF
MTLQLGAIGSPTRPAGRRPLSLAQEQLLFVREVTESNNGYLFPVNVRFRGPLDVSALCTAYTHLVMRHAVLRSRVVCVGGAYFQEVNSEPLDLLVEDLRQLGTERALEVAEERARQEAEQPFDLEQAWIRGCLLRIADDDHVLLLSIHHIAFDGWSRGVLTRELSTLYDCAAADTTPRLEPLTAQVGDIAARERQQIAERAFVKEEEYWTRHLTPHAPDLPLPTDRPRPPLLSGNAGRVWAPLGPDLTAALEQAARRQRCTVYMALLAAFEATLWRASGQTDFCVGAATSGRHDPDAQGLIGLFVNDIAYRSDCAPGQTLGELLSAVKKTALDGYRHQKLPLQRVVELVRPRRQVNRHPLFQHALALQPRTAEDSGFALTGVRTEPFTTLAEGSALDLAMSIHYEDDGLHCTADFSTDLWDEGSVELLVENFRRTLTAMTTDTEAKVEDLDLVEDWVRTPAIPAGSVSAAGAGAPEPDADVLERLRAVWTALLGRPIADQDNFFEVGGDSILALHLANRARAAGVEVRVRDLFAHQTLRALAGSASAQTPPAPEAPRVRPRPTGTMPLLPIQSWFFAGQRDDAHYNFTVLCTHPGELDVHAMRRAVAVTLKRHDASRIRFRKAGDGTVQQHYLDGPGHVPLAVQDLTDRPSAQQARDTLEEIALDVQQSLRVFGDGPLIRCVLFRMPDGGTKLLIAASHLVMDVAGMQVVLEDIAAAYRSLVERRRIELPPVTATVQEWAEALRHHAHDSAELAAELPYWRDVESACPTDFPVDHPDAPNTVRHQRTAVFRLPPDGVRALRRLLPGRPGQSLFTALLAAAGWALGSRIGSRGLVIDLEGHGREDLFTEVDPSRTVGWLTSIYPFALPTGAVVEGIQGLNRLADRYAQLPGNGLGYGLLAEASRGLGWRERAVAFSYMGSMSSARHNESELFAYDDVAPEGARHPDMARRHDLEIDALVVDDALRISLTYGSLRHDESTITGLGTACLEYLQRLSRSCRSRP